MKIYFAGISSNVKRLLYLKQYGANKLMLTFADRVLYKTNMNRFKQLSFDLFLDSGAYSIWKKGGTVDIKEYCDYITQHNIDKYICLDVVGDHYKTLENIKIMKDYGKNPIPVFHYGSNLKCLEYLIHQGYNYICLGGTVGQSTKNKIEFFKTVFDNFPNIKYHGLGITTESIINQFPFYSVDSTTWIMPEKHGKIFNEKGKRVKIPITMSQQEKFKNTIEFFLRFEL